MPIDPKNLPEEIAPYVAAATDYIFNAYKMDLDLSLESLAVIEHYLSKARPLDPALLDLLAAAMGSYFGEALRREMNGSWNFSQGGTPAQWILDLPPGLTLRPVGMVAEALALDEVEGYDGSLYLPDDELQVLQAVLQAQPPLPPERYYALSTRIDVIQKVAESMTAVRNHKDSSQTAQEKLHQK